MWRSSSQSHIGRSVSYRRNTFHNYPYALSSGFECFTPLIYRFFFNISFSVPKKPKAKCSTGLIELKSMALAARTVLLANHMTIESTGNYV